MYTQAYEVVRKVSGWRYLIHYHGWGARFDESVPLPSLSTPQTLYPTPYTLNSKPQILNPKPHP